jgi:hypothetical protein
MFPDVILQPDLQIQKSTGELLVFYIKEVDALFDKKFGRYGVIETDPKKGQGGDDIFLSTAPEKVELIRNLIGAT